MQYINWFTRKLLEYVFDGLALQALISAIALALLVHFHCPIWPAMVIGTWFWAPVVTLAFGIAVLLTLATWLCQICSWSWHVTCIGWYESALLAWFEVLAYLTKNTRAYAIPWPGYSMLALLALGAWVLYTVALPMPRYWPVLRVLMLWLWIGLWSFIVMSCSTVTGKIRLAVPGTSDFLVLSITTDEVALYDNAGILSTGRVRAVWLQRIIIPELIKRGYTHIDCIYTSRISSGVRRKGNLLAHAVGAPQPRYKTLSENSGVYKDIYE